MNGFELREKIETAKRQLKELDRQIQKSAIVHVSKATLALPGTKHPNIPIADLYGRRRAHVENLAKLEVLQEKHNVSTMLTLKEDPHGAPAGTEHSLAEIIKLKGVVQAQRDMIHGSILSTEQMEQWQARARNEDASVACLAYSTDDVNTLVLMRDGLDDLGTQIKSLIAQGNMRVVRE